MRALLGVCVVVAGCLDSTPVSLVEESETVAAAERAADPLPPYVPPAPIREAPLGDDLLGVEVPRTRGGRPAAFTFGREVKHEAWIATLPERARLLSVSYGDGRLYVGGGFGSSAMYALDARTGKRLWTSHHMNDPGPTAVVFAGSEIAFNTYSCTMVVLDAATGKPLWQKWTGSETPNQPAIVGDLVIAPHPTTESDEGGNHSFALSGYRKRDGHEMWASSIDNHILEAPIVHRDSVYVATMSGTLYRIGLDGKRRWKQHVGAASAPWIDGDMVHLAIKAGNRERQVMLAAGDGKTVRSMSETTSPGDMAYDDTSVWGYEGPRPVVSGGVRFAAIAGAVEARDAANGELLWERRQPRQGRRDLNQVIVVGSLVIVAARDGKVIALDRATGDQKLGFDFDTPIAAQPIVAGGWMYVTTTKGQVLGFELGSPDRLDGWHQWGGNARHNL